MELKDNQKLYLIVGAESAYDLEVIKTFQIESNAQNFLQEVRETEEYEDVCVLEIQYYKTCPYIVLMFRYQDNGWTNVVDLGFIDFNRHYTYKEAEAFIEGVQYVDDQYVAIIENITELEIED